MHSTLLLQHPLMTTLRLLRTRILRIEKLFRGARQEKKITKIKKTTETETEKKNEEGQSFNRSFMRVYNDKLRTSTWYEVYVTATVVVLHRRTKLSSQMKKQG